MGDLARATEIDKSDLVKSLNFRAEPTPRTLGRLLEYFGIARAADLNRAERMRSLLIQMNQALLRLVELNTAFLDELKQSERGPVIGPSQTG